MAASLPRRCCACPCLHPVHCPFPSLFPPARHCRPTATPTPRRPCPRPPAQSAASLTNAVLKRHNEKLLSSVKAIVDAAEAAMAKVSCQPAFRTFERAHACMPGGGETVGRQEVCVCGFWGGGRRLPTGTQAHRAALPTVWEREHLSSAAPLLPPCGTRPPPPRPPPMHPPPSPPICPRLSPLLRPSSAPPTHPLRSRAVPTFWTWATSSSPSRATRWACAPWPRASRVRAVRACAYRVQCSVQCSAECSAECSALCSARRMLRVAAHNPQAAQSKAPRNAVPP